ncbi:MAG: DUF6056 family protein [Terracidiphilus sp.]
MITSPAGVDESQDRPHTAIPPAVSRFFRSGEQFHRLAILIAVLACCVLLAVLGILIVFAVPLADDFCRGSIGWRDAISFANLQYKGWTGRWTSMVIESSLFSAFDLYRSVPFILATLLVLRFLALMFLFRQTLRLSLANSALWSLLMIATCVSVMLGIGETLLGAAGAIEYELPLTLTILVLAFLLRSRWIAASPCIVVACSMHELLGLSIIGICVSTLWMYRRERKALRPLAFLILIALAATAFVLLAPGNSARAGSGPHPNAILAIPITTFRVLIWMLRWTVNPATLGLLLFVSGQRKIVNGLRHFDLIGWPFVVVGLALTLIVLSPVSNTPFRVTNLLCFALLLLLVYFSAGLSVDRKYRRGMQIAGLLLLSAGIFTSKNIEDMSSSATKARAYRQAWIERARTHMFERIIAPPSYFDADATSDSSDWYNKCIARYFGLSSVSCPTCEPAGSQTTMTLFRK